LVVAALADLKFGVYDSYPTGLWRVGQKNEQIKSIEKKNNLDVTIIITENYNLLAFSDKWLSYNSLNSNRIRTVKFMILVCLVTVQQQCPPRLAN